MQQAPATTPEQTELWRKVISSPGLLTADERQEMLNKQDIVTKNTNILKISGLTPEEFITKAESGPISLTDAESQHNFYIRTRARDCGY